MVRSTTQRCRPKRVAGLSMPLAGDAHLRMWRRLQRGSAARDVIALVGMELGGALASAAQSACLIGGMASSSCSKTIESWRLAPVRRRQAGCRIDRPQHGASCPVFPPADGPRALAPLLECWRLSRRGAPPIEVVGLPQAVREARGAAASQTPASCQSRKRRQHVIPEPQPNSWGSISQGMPLFEHEDDAGESRAVGDARSATLRLGRLGGNSGLDDRPQFVTHKRVGHGPGLPYRYPVLLGALTIGVRRHDREVGHQGITVAGLLMFGSPAAIREWRGRHLIDFRIASDDPSPLGRAGWQGRVEWEGHLFGAFETIYPRLILGLPAPLKFEGAWRSDDRPWQVALREALVNLLVHADYVDQAPSLILRSDTECVFRNPGSSRVPELGPLTRDRSDPRNPEIFRMFRLIGLAEEAGSGVPRIYAAWQELRLLPPEIDIGIDRNEFTLELKYVHLLSDEDRAWLAEYLGRTNEHEQLALVIALREGSVDNRTLREVTSQHPVDATATLGRLRDEGYLRLIGYGRGARYELDPLLPRPRIGTESGGVPVGAGGDRGDSVVGDRQQRSMSDSYMLEPQSDMPIPESTSTQEVAPPTSTIPKSSSIANRDSAISLVLDTMWETLEAAARPVSSTDYVSSEIRDEVIVSLCAIHELSLLELSWLLNRKKEYLRSVVGALIRSGQLTYSIPEQPRHPAQRYRASTLHPK